jgi:hypothetical protein
VEGTGADTVICGWLRDVQVGAFTVTGPEEDVEAGGNVEGGSFTSWEAGVVCTVMVGGGMGSGADGEDEEDSAEVAATAELEVFFLVPVFEAVFAVVFLAGAAPVPELVFVSAVSPVAGLWW